MAAKVYIIAIRIQGGCPDHAQFIARVWFDANPYVAAAGDGTPVEAMIRYLDERVYDAFVQAPRVWPEVRVSVVRPTGRPAYLRTRADDEPGDNLLSLPRR